MATFLPEINKLSSSGESFSSSLRFASASFPVSPNDLMYELIKIGSAIYKPFTQICIINLFGRRLNIFINIWQMLKIIYKI